MVAMLCFFFFFFFCFPRIPCNHLLSHVLHLSPS